jgi:PPOX class probable FMN-dependent enzyme
MAQITDLAALRRLYPEPHELIARKAIDHLDRHVRAWIALSPFCVLATQGPDGLGDATPRGDGPGFAVVVDDRTLLIPDRPGNNRLDALTNILANPGVGLVFFIPGFDDAMRVNGIAEIRDDEALRARVAVNGRLPATVIVVHVREAFIHCGKAIIRARLWDPATQRDRGTFPTLGEIFKDHTRHTDPPISDAALAEEYRKTLY